MGIDSFFTEMAEKQVSGKMTVGEALIGRYYRILEGIYLDQISNSLETPIGIVLDFDGSEWSVEFPEAGIGGSGDTLDEAIDYIKTDIFERFGYLNKTGADKLSKPLQIQLSVLNKYIRKI